MPENTLRWNISHQVRRALLGSTDDALLRRAYRLARKIPGVRQTWKLIGGHRYFDWVKVDLYVAQGGAFGGNRSLDNAASVPVVDFDSESFFPNLIERIRLCEPRLPEVTSTIVLINNGLSAGGAERQIMNTLLGLKSRGRPAVFIGELLAGVPGQDFHLAAALAAGLDARQLERAVKPGSRRLYDCVSKPVAELLSQVPPDMLLDILNTVHVLRGIRPRLVHLWQDETSIKCAIAALIAGVPKIILSGRNGNPSNFTYHLPYMRPAYRALLKAPGVLFSNNSHAGAKSYADWLGIDPALIQVVHNGLDTAAWPRFDDGHRAAIRKEFEIADNESLVLGVFRLADEKRPLLWIEAAAKLLKHNPNVRFVIAGDGPMKRACIERVSKLGLAGRIHVVGARQNVERLFMAADAFLLTSTFEGIPNVLLEAQWYGVPALVTPAGGAPEAISANVTGRITSFDSPALIAGDLAALLTDVDFRKKARAEGAAFVQRAFGLERMIDETLELYDR
jgi:glycosyltransferase involved in cell wall biosynthesis